jgi:hypothetical protein
MLPQMNNHTTSRSVTPLSDDYSKNSSTEPIKRSARALQSVDNIERGNGFAKHVGGDGQRTGQLAEDSTHRLACSV